MRKLLISLVLFPFLVGCGHPVAVGLVVLLSQQKTKKHKAVGPAVLTITTDSLPCAINGTAYDQTVDVTGGSSPYIWNISAGTLPSGVTLTTDNGQLSGTPADTPLLDYTFTVEVVDSVTDTATQQLTITLYDQIQIVLPGPLPDAINGQVYGPETVAASGGTGNFTWSISSGTLPSGVALTTTNGEIAGTPSDTVTSYPITVAVQDDATPPQTESVALTLYLYDPLAITTTTLPYAINGTLYSEALAATGGTGTYAWSESGGPNLPTGVSILASGVVEGTPADTANTYNFDARVDDDGSPAQNDTLNLSIELYDQLQITTGSALPGAVLGSPYSASLAAVGGTTIYTWTEVTTELATYGLTLSAAGVVSGTPTQVGTCSFTAEVQDDASPAQVAQKALSIAVTDLMADFTGTPTTGSVPLVVDFTNSSVGSATAWEWDFGDGTLDSTNWDTSHTYTVAGWYTVKLVITSATSSTTCEKENYILASDNVWYVDEAGGNDGNGGTSWGDAFASIQIGLDAAAVVTGNYDLVLVADGTYVGADNRNLDFAGEAIYLKTEDYNGTGTWLIDCQSNGRAFLFNDGEGNESTVDGFTIQNGLANPGGGMAFDAASPTIRNCTITSCSSAGGIGDRGGGIHCQAGAAPIIIDCIITGNTSGGQGGDRGGGICCQGGADPTFVNCFIADNQAGGWGGGIYCDNNGTNPVFINCAIVNNEAGPGEGGGGICCEGGADVTLAGCTVANNSADWGGGIYLREDNSGMILHNTIVWGNTGANGAQIRCRDNTTMTLNYCDYADGAGDVEVASPAVFTPTACINTNPVFAAAGSAGVGGGGDYRLQGTSPCIEQGSNALVPAITTDLDGNPRIIGTVDIGAYEYQ